MPSTLLVLSSLLLAHQAQLAHGIITPTVRTRRQNGVGGGFKVSGPALPGFNALVSPTSSRINDVGDLLYSGTVNIGSASFAVQLDTGSSDLWVAPTGPPSTFGATDTQLPAVNITYGLGSVVGSPAIAPVTFGSYSVPQQAFLSATNADMANLFAQNVYGILGLSFPSASLVYQSIAAAGSGAGLPFLQNVFLSQPGQPNMIAFYLGRSGDLEATSPGSFSIGEVDPQYAAVSQAPPLPVFMNSDPNALQRWTVSVDGLEIAGTVYTVASGVASAPGGKQLALLDTGTSRALLPRGAVTAIYSAITGAVYNSDYDVWFVPCLYTTSVAFWIGGQRFQIHPLDLTAVSTAQLQNGTAVSFCVNAYQASDDLSEFDFLLGDSFLRNVFSVYDFGDSDSNGNPTTAPYIQLLSTTDPNSAYPDFQSARGQALSQLPPELNLADPSAVPALLSASSTDAAAAPVSPAPPAPTTPSHRVSFSAAPAPSPIVAGKPIIALADDDTSTPQTTGVSSQVQKLLNLSPIILALLAANIVLGLALCVIGIVIYRQNRGKRNRRGDSIPMPVRRGSEHTVVGSGHYQPVRTTDFDATGGYRDSGVDFDGKYTPLASPGVVKMSDGPGGYRDSGVSIRDTAAARALGSRAGSTTDVRMSAALESPAPDAASRRTASPHPSMGGEGAAMTHDLSPMAGAHPVTAEGPYRSSAYYSAQGSTPDLAGIGAGMSPQTPEQHRNSGYLSPALEPQAPPPAAFDRDPEQLLPPRAPFAGGAMLPPTPGLPPRSPERRRPMSQMPPMRSPSGNADSPYRASYAA